MTSASTTTGYDAPRTTLSGAWTLLIVLCGAQFMLVLDISVTNVALASIQSSLGFRAADLQWIITAYTLVFGGLLILGGRAGDLYGRRQLFLLGVAAFALASLLCGLAQSPGQLIAARGLQGVAAAVVSPAALSLITSGFAEGRARTTALSVWGTVVAGGAAAGMIIGGVVTDVASWRWVFFINVPIGVVTVLAATRVLPRSARITHQRLDITGALAVTVGIAALVLAVSQVQPRGFGSGVVITAFVVALVMLASFVVIETRTASPIVPFDLFANRSVTSANLFTFLSSAVVVGQSYFLSLYLRQVLGYSPLRTGLALVPITLVVIGIARLIPTLLPVIGLRWTLAAAGVLLAVGMLLQSRMPTHGSYLDVLPGLVVTAAGLGCSFVAATIAATTGVAPDRAGLASGVLNTAQQVGGAVGLAVLVSLAASRTAHTLARGHGAADALTAGFHAGFLGATVVSLAATAIAIALVPGSARVHSGNAGGVTTQPA